MNIMYVLSLFIYFLLLTGLLTIAFMFVADVKMTKAKALVLMGYGVTLMSSCVAHVILLIVL